MVLPSPFRSARQNPRAVLIRPTVGEFTDYCGGDLHVGVSDASGQVLAFDVDGLRRRPDSEWSQCLVITLSSGCPSSDAAEQTGGTTDGSSGVTLAMASCDRLWDEAIANFVASKEWPAESYQEISRNCFSFLLAFLERADALASPGPWTRERFAAEYVLPVSRRAAKYLTLKRRAMRDGWYALGESTAKESGEASRAK